jgi:predicted nucleic acid-binding protein
MAQRKAYVDSSVVLRSILRQPGATGDWLDAGAVVTSELLELEAWRTLDRLRLLGRLAGPDMAAATTELRAYLEGIEVVPLQPAILRRAAQPLPVPVGALDAIHLVTALIWSERRLEDLVVFTHDRQLAAAAQACGLAVHPG